MSTRKNSFDNKDRCNSRDSRSWSIGSIGSIGSIETIKMDEEPEKEKAKGKKIPVKRRKRETNIDNMRRDSPNPTYWGLLLMDFLKKKQINGE